MFTGASYRTCGRFYSEADQEPWKVLSRGVVGLPAVGRSDLEGGSVRKEAERSGRGLLQECTLDQSSDHSAETWWNLECTLDLGPWNSLKDFNNNNYAF